MNTTLYCLTVFNRSATRISGASGGLSRPVHRQHGFADCGRRRDRRAGDHEAVLESHSMRTLTRAQGLSVVFVSLGARPKEVESVRLRSPMGLAAFLLQRILPLAALPFSASGVYRAQFR